jgi:hypothetical protein
MEDHMKKRVFFVGILVMALVFGLVLAACEDPNGDPGNTGQDAGKTGPKVLKVIDITGITNTNNIVVMLASDLGDPPSSVVTGKGSISNGTLTIDLKAGGTWGTIGTENWTGSGRYYVVINDYSAATKYAYTNGAELDNGYGATRLTFDGAITTVSFSKFKAVVPDDNPEAIEEYADKLVGAWRKKTGDDYMIFGFKKGDDDYDEYRYGTAFSVEGRSNWGGFGHWWRNKENKLLCKSSAFGFKAVMAFTETSLTFTDVAETINHFSVASTEAFIPGTYTEYSIDELDLYGVWKKQSGSNNITLTFIEDGGWKLEYSIDGVTGKLESSDPASWEIRDWFYLNARSDQGRIFVPVADVSGGTLTLAVITMDNHADDQIIRGFSKGVYQKQP